MKKIQNIQAIRGMAVLFVVFFHLAIIEKKYGGSQTLLSDIIDFGMFGVDLFFVVSGFVMVVVTRGKHHNSRQAIRFIYHRVSRIYPIYWLYSILVLGILLIKPAWVNSGQTHIDILSSFLLLPADTLPLVMVGWSLIHEMYFYIMFFFMLLLLKKQHMNLAIFLWMLTVVLCSLLLDLTSAYTKLIFHPLTIEFIGGYFIAKLYYSSTDKTVSTKLLLSFSIIGIIVAIVFYAVFRHMTGQITPHGWTRILIFGLPAMLVVYALINVERNGIVIHSMLVNIGDASYSIYLSHIMTLNGVGKIWSLFANDGIYDNILFIPILLMLVIVVGFASYHLAEKPMLALTRKIY